MTDLTALRAGDHVGTIRRRGRRLDTYSVALGGGLVANVSSGRLASIGLEPVGPIVPRLTAVHDASAHDGDVRRHARRVWAVAAPLAGTVAAGAAVATGIVLRHRRAA